MKSPSLKAAGWLQLQLLFRVGVIVLCKTIMAIFHSQIACVAKHPTKMQTIPSLAAMPKEASPDKKSSQGGPSPEALAYSKQAGSATVQQSRTGSVIMESM